MFINSWGFRRRRESTDSSLHSTGCHWCDFNSAWKPFLRFSLLFFAQKHGHSESTRFSTLLNVDINFAVVIKDNSLLSSECQVSSASMSAIQLLTGIRWVDRLKVSTGADYCDALYWDVNSSDLHSTTSTASHSRATQATNITDHPGNLCHPAEWVFTWVD